MKPSIPDDSALLSVFAQDSTHPLHVREIAERLGVPFTHRRALETALDALASRGLVGRMSGSRYRKPKVGAAEMAGRFTQNPRGFGFVATEDGDDDVFIPPSGVGGAMHGDRVMITAQRGDKGREGAVVRIVARRSPRIPGTLHTRNGSASVEPDDMRVRGPITVDELNGAADGDAVLCEITRFPEHPGELPVGTVREALGRPGSLDVEVRKVILREAVDEDFPRDALEAAAALPPRLQPEDYAGREDLRALPLVTIDPDDARDHDDAVYVRRRDDGGYVALVAIADVSHYVRPGTALDNAALSRGTSIYLPDRAIPMLPHELSSHLASLIDNEDRLTLAIEIELASDGRIEKSRLIEGVMRCQASLTYSNLAYVMGWGNLGKASEVAEKYRADLEAAADLASALRQKRSARGSLDLDLPEARVRFAQGERVPIDIVQSRQDPGLKRAYSVIEELMLLANEEIAATCIRARVPTIFRVHGAPDDEALTKLATVARAFGHEVDPEEIAHPRKLAKFLRHIADLPEAATLHRVLLRALPQARYQVDNTGHFGLAAEAYLHFTSPIRRYPDVVVHRVVRALARGEHVSVADPSADEAMRLAAFESSRLERRAMDVERDVMNLYCCVVAQAHVGEIHEGKVGGLSNTGPFVQIDNPFVDVLVKLADFGDDDWQVDDLGLHVTGARSGLSFVLGQPLTVEITDVSLTRRTIYAKVPDELRAALPRKRPKKLGAAKKGGRNEARPPVTKKGKRPAGKKRR